MIDVQARFKEAWSHALAGVNAAEQGAEKVLGRIADAAGFTPEDVKRQARDLADKLQKQRKGLEKVVDEAVRSVSSRVRLPSRGEVETLKQRVDALSVRLDALEGEKNKPV